MTPEDAAALVVLSVDVIRERLRHTDWPEAQHIANALCDEVERLRERLAEICKLERLRAQILGKG